MQENNAIEVRDITKSFKVYLDKSNDIKSFMLHGNRRKYEKRQVLNGISFEVKKGEAIGLIGHNGCGKSTTLKLLTRIMYPDNGSIEIKGRVSSLIELGAGFHPDMSGRENIYINASIFGLSKKEIDERIDDIIAFSELEDFIDNPVRTYSSGMYMRLAFSVAINVDADVLLIDEILAVGDATFQSKCFNKLREIKSLGTTIVIVSHSLSQLEQICDRNIWIDNGLIKMEGIPDEVDFSYLEYMTKKTKKSILTNEAGKNSDGGTSQLSKQNSEKKNIEIISVKILHEDGSEDGKFKVGEPAILKIDYKVNDELDDPILGLKIYRCDSVNSYGTNTQNERIHLELEGTGCIKCRFDNLDLVASEYYVDVAFRAKDMMIYDYVTKATSFITYYAIYEEGIAHLNHTWDF